MKNTILILIMLISVQGLHAQHVMGTVAEVENGEDIPVIGATVVFLGTTVGTRTDETGMFHLDKPDKSADQLVISYVGYKNDTIPAVGTDIKVVLQKSIELQGVEITAKDNGSYISQLKPLKTEVLTTNELRKNACCNLSESFESNPTVDVAFSDAVTGAKQIQLLGLSGVYVQTLTDVLPTLRGLATTYGLTYIPGSWIESIQMNKGTGSVANGYESITGQINVELKKPEISDKLFVNLYTNSEQRGEANVLWSHRLNSKWSTMLLTHGSGLQQKIDHNRDGFLDIPLSKQLNAFNRWKFESGKHIEAMFGVKALVDEKKAGQTSFNFSDAHPDSSHYGINLNTTRVETFLKSSYTSLKKEYQSVGIQLSGIYHQQDGFYGVRNYSGTENYFYSNMIFQSAFNNTMHTYRTGLSFVYDDIDEKFGELNLKRTEVVPGAFFEYTYDNSKNFAMVAGVRGDYNSVFGAVFTPRIHAKYNLTKTTVLRASAGNGFRTVNIFSENAAFLASSREFIIKEKLNPERAWNGGINLTQNFHIGNREATWGVDFYRTQFQNKVIADVYSNPQQIVFYNLRGESYANSFQTDVNMEVVKNLNVRLAYKYNDVKETINGKLSDKPLVPKQRALFNIAYDTPDKHWKFDFTTQWVGEQQLPVTESRFQTPDYSPDYFRLLGQVTYMIKQWEFYVGGENLTDYTQPNPIIASNDPFGPYFDSSVVWGPITGRMFYGGLRFTIK